MDTLKRLIYHEKQEQGSMLCAQHALNALLQGNYFSASDLSVLASGLDDLEGSYRNRDAAPTASVNMDDSGFFSIQVMEKALQVWGLCLVPWSSGELAEFHHDPNTQQAFILNLDQHWFTIRRFGSPDGHRHWFNLNSFLESPEHVSGTYLSMMLDESEIEGYSVLAIRPLPESPEISVPACEADEVASTVSESDLLLSRHISQSSTSAPGGATTMDFDLTGFEGEDLELQRALQASLANFDTVGFAPRDNPPSPPVTRVEAPSAFAESARRGFDAAIEQHEQVQASAARGQALLERARREQAMALQEGVVNQSAGAQRQRSRAEEEEEEMIRRAMEESLRSSSHASRAATDDDDDDDAYNDNDDDDDDNDDYSDADDSLVPIVTPSRVPPSAVPQIQRSDPVPLAAINHSSSRVVDDEDAELQAALRASLEGLPEGFAVPETPPRRLIHTSTATTSAMPPEAAGASGGMEDDEHADVRSPEPPESPVAEKPDVDEIRRRRLARFGTS